MNRESFTDKLFTKDKENLYKQRKRSARLLYMYIICEILTFFIIITNGPSSYNVGMMCVFAFCIYISQRNKKIIKSKTQMDIDMEEDDEEDDDEGILSYIDIENEEDNKE